MRSKVVTREKKASDLATRQHGVIAYRQLTALGFAPAAIQRRAEAGRFHPLHRGVYAMGHARVSRQGSLMAAVLAAGPGAVLSHRSAVALWGLRPSRSGRIEVTTTGRGRPPSIQV